ncbi:MAG: hypothetical protein O2825_15030, partial [Proteobacteria bacterium]|nr:hypothetical protein [Pseudomonadota bacterium]
MPGKVVEPGQDGQPGARSKGFQSPSLPGAVLEQGEAVRCKQGSHARKQQAVGAQAIGAAVERKARFVIGNLRRQARDLGAG